MNKIVLIINRLQRLTLYLFFFSINFEVWDPFNTAGHFSISKLTGILYLITIIPHISLFSRTTKIRSFLLTLWLFYLLLTLSSLIHVNNYSDDFFDVTIFLNIIIFMFLINHERKDNLVLEKGMLSFAFGSVLLAILFYAGVGVEYSGGRVSIFGDNQNTIGIRMSVSMVILLLTLLQNRLNFKKYRYLLLLPVPLMLGLLIATGSRVAFISFITSIFIGSFLIKTKKVFNKFAIVFLGGLGVFYMWTYLQQTEILYSRFLLSTEGDFAGRLYVWDKLIPLILDNPIIGVGKTGYAYFAQANFGFIISPHNVFLEVLCYTGISGLIVYLFFLLRILKCSYRTYRIGGWILPLLLCVPVFGLLISGQILGVKLGWIIFSYIVANSLVVSKVETVENWDVFITDENSLRN